MPRIWRCLTSSALLLGVSSCSGEVPPRPGRLVVVDTSALQQNFDYNASNRAPDVVLELDAYAGIDLGWTARDEAAFRGGFRAATLNGKPVAYELALEPLEGRKAARHVRIHYSIPPGETVVAGWYGGSVTPGGASPYYDTPSMIQGADGSHPGLIFAQTAASCPRIVAFDVAAKGDERSLTFRFSEAVQLGAKPDATVEARAWGPDLVETSEHAKVSSSQTSATEVTITVNTAALPKSSTVFVRVEDFVPELTGFATNASCERGSEQFMLGPDALNLEGRRWLGLGSGLADLAWNHEATVKEWSKSFDAQ